MSALTVTGLSIDTTDQILTKLETSELANIDAGLNTAPTQPLGQLNGIVASQAEDALQLQQATYSALDPNNAEGAALDTCCALSGTTRKPASSTVASCTGTGTPFTAFTGATIDSAGNIVTPGQVLAQIAGHPEFVFCNRDPFSISAGGGFPAPAAGPTYFVCLQTGAIACNAGTLTVISPAVTGLTSITNPADASLGSPIESDAQLRIRRLVELIPANGGTVDSMRATLKAIKGNGPGLQGVIEAFVFENPTNATDSNGLPPHSTLAVIWDGGTPQAANNDIAQAIWNAKGSGITAYDAGSGLTGIAIDKTGKSHTIGFARAAQLSMYINITVAIDNTFDTVNGPAAIQALLATYGNTSVQGQSVVPLDFTSQARVSIKGVRNVPVFQIDSHSSPTNTAEILLGITQIARYDTSRIAVSTTPFT